MAEQLSGRTTGGMPSPKCSHGSRCSRCRECGGVSLCTHSKRCSRCRECGGSSFCTHGKQRSRCSECVGSSICAAHGKQRSRCGECGGTPLCTHGKQRSRCRECGGASICTHGKQRSRCSQCGGSSICAAHGKQRSRCGECGGTPLCTHGKQRSRCRECGGASICTHGKRRDRCRECGGSAFCVHVSWRSRCGECRGGAVAAVAKGRAATASPRRPRLSDDAAGHRPDAGAAAAAGDSSESVGACLLCGVSMTERRKQKHNGALFFPSCIPPAVAAPLINQEETTIWDILRLRARCAAHLWAAAKPPITARGSLSTACAAGTTARCHVRRRGWTQRRSPSLQARAAARAAAPMTTRLPSCTSTYARGSAAS